jgi:hypothetical protein
MAAATPPEWDQDDFSGVVDQPLDPFYNYLQGRSDIFNIDRINVNEKENLMATPCEDLPQGSKNVVIYYQINNNAPDTIAEEPIIFRC